MEPAGAGDDTGALPLVALLQHPILVSPLPPSASTTHSTTPPHPTPPPQDGDTVIIGDLEFEYDSDRSEAGMYDKWYRARREAGVVGKGQARWPHVTG